MADYRERYEFWKNSSFFDEATRAELAALTDEKEIEDRFYRDLEFGTGGARGLMGAGTNRINSYNVRRISQGFAAYLLKTFGEDAKKMLGRTPANMVAIHPVSAGVISDYEMAA